MKALEARQVKEVLVVLAAAVMGIATKVVLSSLLLASRTLAAAVVGDLKLLAQARQELGLLALSLFGMGTPVR